MADAGSFNADLGVNLQFNVDGAGLVEMSRTIKEISKGKDLQRYWKDVETATDNAGKAIERYSRNVNSQGLAESFLKQINALKAITQKENLSELFPNMDINFDELIESAKKVAPRISSEFSVSNFEQAFKTFDLLRDKGIELGEVFSRLADYVNVVKRNSELSRENSEFRNLLGDADIEKLKKDLGELQNLRLQAEREFESFLNINKIERTDFWGDEKFSEYFTEIRNGSMTATDAIARFKTEYGYLLEESFKTNSDTFGIEQLQAFSNKLDSIFRQVEEISTKINDIISNGVIAKSVENLSMDSSLSDSQRSLFGNLLQDEESLKSITALFQKLIEESNKTSKVDLFNDEQLQQVLSIFDKMEKHLSSLRSIISDVGDGEEFSPLLKMINNVQSSISELATSVKGIGLNMNIDVGSDSEMEAKVQSKIANALQAYQRLFDAIKMSGAGGSVINTNFFEFDINQYDTMMSKIQAYKKFIDNMRNEAKAQYNGKDILYQSVDKTYWTQASAAMGQVTKAFNEMNVASDTNPLKDLFGSGDLSEVISQLGLIVAKLEEISTTASSFKNVFDNGFNVTASVEEIDKLTNRVKELEDELAKIKLNPVNVDKSNISSENDSLQSTIEALKQLSKLPGGDTLSLGKIMNHIAEGAKLANPEVKKLLESLKLIDSEGKIISTHINEGTLNSGVDLNDKFAIISRNDAIENVDKLIEKEKEAQQQGILLARTLASVDIGKLHYDIQELAQGNSVHQMKNSTLQQFIDETRVLCNATDEQILKLYSDAQKLSDLGFKLDLNPSNIRYDENSGFSFIDLELRKINEEAPQTVAIMHTLTQSLMGFMGQRNRLNWDDEENFYTKDNYLYLQNMLKTYERLQQIFSSKLSTPDFNQAFSDSLQLVKTRIADIEAHFENLGTPIEDVFQGDKIGQVTTSAKELDNTLEQVNIPTDSFDEVLSKLDLAKSELGEIVKITKQSVSDSEGKFHDSYTLKDKRGSTEIYGLSSNTEKGQLLRSNIIEYDAKEIEKANKQILKSEQELQAQKNAFHKKNISAIDLEIQKREEESKMVSSALKTQMEERQKQLSSMESSLKSYQDKAFNLSIKPDEANRFPEYQAQLDSINKAINDYSMHINSLQNKGVIDPSDIDEANRLKSIIKELLKNTKKFSSSDKGFTNIGADKVLEKINTILEQNSRMSKTAKDKIKAYYNEIYSGNPTRPLNEILDSVYKIVQQEREAGRAGKSWLEIFKDKKIYSFLGQAASMFSFYDLIRYGREGIDTIREFDDGLTKISYTMDMTKSQLNDLGKSVLEMANDLDSSINNAMQVSQIYANMNTSAEEIKKLSEPTLILSNLTGFDASTVADDIQAVTQQFDIAAESSMHIADVYDQISRNISVDYSKGIESIAEAVQVAGSTANQAGLSFEQLAAIVGKTVEKTRLEGSQVGNGLKTIMTRLSKVGELSEEVDNETLSQASESLKKVGIEVYNLDGSYREFDVIMGELAGKWSDLTDAEKSNISFNIAATRQTNLLSAVLSNFSDSMQLAEEATNANGNALENNQKWVDSFGGHLQSLENTAKSAWINILDSETIKGGVDVLNSLLKVVVELIDTFGLLPTAAAIGGGILGGKNIGREKCYPSYRICL